MISPEKTVLYYSFGRMGVRTICISIFPILVKKSSGHGLASVSVCNGWIYERLIISLLGSPSPVNTKLCTQQLLWLVTHKDLLS